MHRAALLCLLALGATAIAFWWWSSDPVVSPVSEPEHPSDPRRTGNNPPGTAHADATREKIHGSDPGSAPGEPAATTSAATTDAAFVLRGLVVQGETPVPGATVVARHGAGYSIHLRRETEELAKATTDATGAFELRVDRAPIHVLASAPGRRALDILTVHTRGDRSDLRLTLYGSRTVRGRAVDAANQPVASAEITVSQDGSWKRRRSAEQAGLGFEPAPRIRSTTDAEGRFALVVPESERWNFAAVKKWKTRKIRASTVIDRPWEQEVLLTLTPDSSSAGYAVWGYAIEPNGGPVANARVRLVGGPWIDADASGLFRLTGVKGSRLVLVGDAPGRTTTMQKLDPIDADTGPIYLRLPVGKSLAGILVDEQGQPIPGARIEIDGDPQVSWSGAPPTTLLKLTSNKIRMTDEEGRFEFTGLQDKSYRLSWREAQAPYRYAIAAIPAGNRAVRLQAGQVEGPGVTFQGTVLDEATNQPIPGASVDVSRDAKARFGSAAYGIASAVADRAGRFASRGLEPARYSISASAKGFAPSATEMKDYGFGEHSVSLSLARERQLVVLVLGVDGNPAAGGAVQVIGENGRTISIKMPNGGRQSPVYADEAGKVVLGGIPARQVKVRALAEWWQPATEVDVDARDETSNPIELRLKVQKGGPARMLSVRLLAPSGKPAQVRAGCSFLVETTAGVLLTKGAAAWNGTAFETQTNGKMKRESSAATLKFYGPKFACTLRITAPGYAPASVSILPGSADFTATMTKN